MTEATSFARLAAFEAAKRDLKDRFYNEWQRVSADFAAELAELDRRYWAGEPVEGAPAKLKAAA